MEPIAIDTSLPQWGKDDIRSIIREEVAAMLRERGMGSIDEIATAVTRYMLVQSQLRSSMKPMEFK